MAEAKEPTLNSKEMLENAGKENRKVRYNERMQVEIIADTKHYKKGMVINPHTVVGEQLIKDKIAKSVK